MASDNRFPQVGEVFEDRYQVERVIGRGGFSRVYLARQMDLDRLVALKVLNPDSEKIPDGTRLDVIVKRFAREARTISKLKDSHTVVMHDYGRTAQDLLYMVLEHVDGMNLRQLVAREGAIAPGRVVVILRQILSSLQEAHAFGILHRDIKPQNVMVYEHVGRRDQVKVLDFGIAKTFADKTNVDTMKLTIQGNIVGTPRYMSPEQLRGDMELGPPSDLYSVGLVAYELLVGQKVAAELSGLHVVERHLNSKPILLPDDLEIPVGLRDTLHGMMAKSLTKRYTDCSEVLEALEGWKSGSSEPPGKTAELGDQAQNDPKASALPGVNSFNKATLQMSVKDLSALTEQAVADTVQDRPKLDPAGNRGGLSSRLSGSESDADTVLDRPAVQLPANTILDRPAVQLPPKPREESTASEAREFEAPANVLESSPDREAGSATYAKVALLLLGGTIMAYVGWYVSGHIKSAGANVEERADAIEEPISETVAAGIPSAELDEARKPSAPPQPGEATKSEARIETMTSAISIATHIADTSWRVAGASKTTREAAADQQQSATEEPTQK